MRTYLDRGHRIVIGDVLVFTTLKSMVASFCIATSQMLTDGPAQAQPIVALSVNLIDPFVVAGWAGKHPIACAIRHAEPAVPLTNAGLHA